MTITIKAAPVGGTTKLTWRFSVARANELELVGNGASPELFPIATLGTNFGNGLTITNNRNAHIRTQATNANWGDYSTNFGSGCLTMDNNANLGEWATLTGIPAGMVKITVKFSGTGGTNFGRNPNFKFGAAGAVQQFTACPATAAENEDNPYTITTDSGNASNSLFVQTLTVNKANAGDDIIFNGTGNFRLWELVVEYDN